MRRAVPLVPLAMLWLTVLAGCAAPATEPRPSATPSATSAPAVLPTGTTSEGAPLASEEEQALMATLDEEGRRKVEDARTELAAKLGVATGAIRVVQAESIMWSDASLGCPEPGKMYAQVFTPGFVIVLEQAGVQYEYHAGPSRTVLCQPDK